MGDVIQLTNFNVHGPAFLLSILPQLGDRVGQVGSKRTIDKGLQLEIEGDTCM